MQLPITLLPCYFQRHGCCTLNKQPHNLKPHHLKPYNLKPYNLKPYNLKP